MNQLDQDWDFCYLCRFAHDRIYAAEKLHDVGFRKLLHQNIETVLQGREKIGGCICITDIGCILIGRCDKNWIEKIPVQKTIEISIDGSYATALSYFIGAVDQAQRLTGVSHECHPMTLRTESNFTFI